MIQWHRLFGLALVDFFSGSPFVVELEKDLSIKQQFLDVVILRKEEGEFQGSPDAVGFGTNPYSIVDSRFRKILFQNQRNRNLPDGLDNLAQHNLLLQIDRGAL